MSVDFIGLIAHRPGKPISSPHSTFDGETNMTETTREPVRRLPGCLSTHRERTMSRVPAGEHQPAAVADIDRPLTDAAET